MKTLDLGRRAVSVLLCAALSGALLTGCKKGDDMFPSISSQTDPSEVSEETEEPSEETTGGDIRQLKVALPYSDLTVQCLASMFYCKNNGTWDSNESGLTIDTDYLSNVATNYVVINMGCVSTGASLDNVKSWNSTSDAPDLFLAQDSESIWNAGLCEELNPYLAEDPYLNSQQIYSGALVNDSEDGIVYAVPHYCSAEIVMGNTEYIPTESGKLQTKNTVDDLKSYVEEIVEEYPSCAGFASAYDLIPYLGSAFNGDTPTSYMLCKEYGEDQEGASLIIDEATSYVRGYYDDELTNDITTGADPVYSRTAALWVDSSANVSAWSEYFPNSLYLLHLPCDDVTNVGVPYISTYSLCVSKGSENSEFASAFASFISFDQDAQLLIYRLESMTGLMPLTRNDTVWDLISEDELFGHMASDFRQTMDNAVYCPASYDNKVYANTNEYTAEFIKGDDEFDPEKCYG